MPPRGRDHVDRPFAAARNRLASGHGGAGGAASAPQPPRSFVASPDIYKVIAVTWRPGRKDELPSRPASAVYSMNDCSVRIYAPDGSSREAQPRAGYAAVQAPIAGHVPQNVGTTDCRVIVFEPA